MPTDLHHVIATTPLADTHEHQQRAGGWIDNGGGILQDLFGNYVPADLHCAGMPGEAWQALNDNNNPDIAARFKAVQPYFERVQHTGYGEGVRLVGRIFYDLEPLTPESVAAAAPRAEELRKPNERLRICRDVANLDHCQIDDFQWSTTPDDEAPGFFYYDLSWCSFSDGSFDPAQVAQVSGVEVTDLASLGQAMAALFDKFAPLAIAVKSQHAYSRTLRWSERSESDVARMLALKLGGHALNRAEADCLGDWCWARGVELSIEHNLPFKHHTGYYAGNDRMPVDYIPAGNLCGLLARYPAARFVLMHAAYPYTSELVALAKQYRNVYADCCWAWQMNPLQIVRFVREFIHAAPSNKLFIFGGDTSWPTGAAAYAAQCRRWLERALAEEVADGDLTEAEACRFARQVMVENQHAVFDLEGKRAANRAAWAIAPAA
ncbi:MAG: amidohydrolase family protein [Armatimonadetes bacterium]|nr:amidohydrolase family protein [Armatimonadota bacterium]